MITETQLLAAEKIKKQKRKERIFIERAINAGVCPKCNAPLIDMHDDMGDYCGCRCSNNPTFIERMFSRRKKTCNYKS